MKFRDIPHLLRDTFQQWREEDLTRLGAALAYYAAFSLIPLLMVTAVLYSALIGTQQAESRIGQVVNQFIGEQAAQTIQEMVSNINGGHIPRQ